jgi:hypothetical protein
MITIIGDIAVSDSGFTLKVVNPNPYDPQGFPEIEYREGDKVLKGALESHWSLKVQLSRTWESPYENEVITPEKGKQIQENILEALDSLGHYYYSF